MEGAGVAGTAFVWGLRATWHPSNPVDGKCRSHRRPRLSSRQASPSLGQPRLLDRAGLIPGPQPALAPGRGIIVLNGNFAPAAAAGPLKYGAVAYALRVAEALDRLADCWPDSSLYRRNERLHRPRLEPVSFLGYPALELGFHFAMDRRVLTAAVEDARLRLDRGRLYYQTNVLLPFHPPGRPFVVTHHAPFVDHVVEVMGPRLAAEAFGAGSARSWSICGRVSASDWTA